MASEKPSFVSRETTTREVSPLIHFTRSGYFLALVALLGAARPAHAQGSGTADAPGTADATARTEAPAKPEPPSGSPEAAAAETARLEKSEAPPLRLEDAIRLAMTNNERARKIPLRIETAEGQLERARTAFFPSLTAGGSGSLQDTADRNGRQLTTNGTLTLAQPLLNPSAFPQYAQSRHQLESEKWGAAQDRRVLGFDTARTFLQVLTAERVFEAAKRSAERAQGNLDDTQARVDAQLASTNDATRARIALATAQRSVAQAQGNVSKAYLQLGFLVGQRVQGPLAAPDRTTSSAERFGSTPAQALDAARDRRPDLRSAHERTEALRASAREPLYRLIPSLGAQAQLRVIPDPAATERLTSGNVSLNLTWQIFDAGARYADRKTRLAQADSQALDEQLLRRSVETDTRIAVAGLRAARDTYTIANDALAQAQLNVEETEILYRQGLARAIELTDANASRFDAEVTRATAKLQMEQAYLDLRFALGLDAVDDDGKGSASP